MAGADYWAFISYSHADRAVAGWLHRALENYLVPRRIIGQPTPFGPAPPRLRPIFRDTAELAADPRLGDRLSDALARSRWLIVVCSPSAARSHWVEEEVRQFIGLHGEARVLAVIAAGTAGGADSDCFPPSLRGVTPVAADLRPGRGGRRMALLKLVAGMLGVGLDDLVRRDVQRRQARTAALAAALGAAAAVTTALAVSAVLERNEARRQRFAAEGLVEFMLGDLRAKLEPQGRLDVLAAVGDRALAYYGAQSGRGLDAGSLARRARVLRMLGEIAETRGDLAGAGRQFDEAARATAELLRRRPRDRDLRFDHAQSVYYLGELADRRGRTAAAAAQFVEYRRLILGLVAEAPHDPRYLAELDDADSNIGAMYYRQGRFADARAAFESAMTVSRALAANALRDRDRQWDLAESLSWLADCDAVLGRPEDSLRERMAQRAIYAALLSRDPEDNLAADGAVWSGVRLAHLPIVPRSQAQAILAKAVADSERLVGVDPSNTLYLQHAVQAKDALARLQLDSGRLHQASILAAAAARDAETLAQRDPTVSLWQGSLLANARLLRIRVEARLAPTAAACRAALAPAAAEADRLEHLRVIAPDDRGLAVAAAEAALFSGEYTRRRGDFAAATGIWRRAADSLLAPTNGSSASPGQAGGAILAEIRQQLVRHSSETSIDAKCGF